MIILTIITIVSYLGFFSIFIFAQSPVLTVRVSNIVNNDTIYTANVTLWNVSNGALIGHNTTQNGVAEFHGLTDGPFYIDVNISQNYYNRTDDNSGGFYLLGSDTFVTEEVYPINRGSFNITLTDSANGRPVPDVEILVYPQGSSGSEPQTTNYRCNAGVCRTDENGNILLIVTQNPPQLRNARIHRSGAHRVVPAPHSIQQPISRKQLVPVGHHILEKRHSSRR